MTKLRPRVLVLIACLLGGGLAVWRYTQRDPTIQELDATTINQSIGQNVRLTGEIDKFLTVTFRDKQGNRYTVIWNKPPDAPPGNKVLITGQISGLNAQSQPQVLKLANMEIVDLKTRAPAVPVPPPPVPTLRIEVIAKQYDWSFRYPNGRVSSELHMPRGVTVKLELTSPDVIHAMYLQSARSKSRIAGASAVPGSTTSVVVTPVEPGASRILCAEFCGPGHQRCGAPVFVEDGLPEFERWLERLDVKNEASSATTTRPAAQSVSP